MNDLKLKKFLTQLQKDYHQASFLSSDPLEFVHRYSDPWDQEAVALLAAVLAYGNVKQIRKSVECALEKIHQLEKSPREFISKLSHGPFQRRAESCFKDFVHRFNCGNDLILLFRALNKSWKTYGSLGAHFLHYLKPEDLDFGEALSLLISDLRKSVSAEATETFSYLLTSPSDGSCCKRWCMFLRWMGRKDNLDLGLWTQGSPLIASSKCGTSKNVTPTGSRGLEARQLVMPLDTHTGRISQYLGLTSRKSINWKAALEVTESLKKLDPTDPTRYDFAIARLGILDLCQRKYREEICKKCQLLPVCHFAHTQKLLSGSSRSTQYSV